MKPFDLESAKRGDPIIDVYGRDYRFIAHIPDALEHNRVVVLGMETKATFTCSEKGKNLGYKDPFLYMKPIKKTVYVNFYPNEMAAYHETEKRALECVDPNVIASAVPVEIEL